MLMSGVAAILLPFTGLLFDQSVLRSAPALAVDPLGTASFAWLRSDGANNQDLATVKRVCRSARVGGGRSAPRVRPARPRRPASAKATAARRSICEGGSASREGGSLPLTASSVPATARRPIVDLRSPIRLLDADDDAAV